MGRYSSLINTDTHGLLANRCWAAGRFIVNRIVRSRFACSGCEAFTQAALPSRPIERGRPGLGLLAHVLVNK
jgi:transposase